jgi:predicted AAA+ superfamily ATPase
MTIGNIYAVSIMYKRLLNLADLAQKRSYFLFGPRASGKTTLIKSSFPEAKRYDLLNARVYSRLMRDPTVIEQETDARELVVIDEIQKLPSILDEVHRLIEERGQRFILTGSSARKLKRGAANLLGGRAFQASLFPLCSAEIPNFDLLAYLNTTGLPEFYNNPLCSDFLEAYVSTYLKEEVQGEGLVRNLPAFSRFLDVMALVNGEEVNFASIASDAGVPVRTLQGYLSILEDTLLGFTVPSFSATVKRKAITRPKFYLFDVGVVNYLARRGKILEGSELFGKAFEHLIALELRAWVSYSRSRLTLQYWRSTSQFEVDFVVGDTFAVEVKATNQVSDRHLAGLRALAEEKMVKNLYVVSCDSTRRQTKEGITIFPWREFLCELWANKLV